MNLNYRLYCTFEKETKYVMHEFDFTTNHDLTVLLLHCVFCFMNSETRMAGLKTLPKTGTCFAIITFTVL